MQIKEWKRANAPAEITELLSNPIRLVLLPVISGIVVGAIINQAAEIFLNLPPLAGTALLFGAIAVGTGASIGIGVVWRANPTQVESEPVATNERAATDEHGLS